MRTNHDRNRRGLTMAIALMLLVIVASALVAMARLVSDDARRTLDERRGAQLRLLLLAARDSALAELATNGALASSPLRLPAESGDAAVSIESIGDAGHTVATARARLDDYRLNSRFEFGMSAGKWKVIKAELDVP